ncbi:unnamed protein product [Ambrosiozyma monospora]|uniref:Unnamed protein product n=1 Tax=Ambrosiozyma monospora TaxID=43982 RepID=A0A9W7DIC0_AMBMO|nr:unnamed protein product [Ambrosiozyma monospora]
MLFSIILGIVISACTTATAATIPSLADSAFQLVVGASASHNYLAGLSISLDSEKQLILTGDATKFQQKNPTVLVPVGNDTSTSTQIVVRPDGSLVVGDANEQNYEKFSVNFDSNGVMLINESNFGVVSCSRKLKYFQSSGDFGSCTPVIIKRQ